MGYNMNNNNELSSHPKVSTKIKFNNLVRRMGYKPDPIRFYFVNQEQESEAAGGTGHEKIYAGVC